MTRIWNCFDFLSRIPFRVIAIRGDDSNDVDVDDEEEEQILPSNNN